MKIIFNAQLQKLYQYSKNFNTQLSFINDEATILVNVLQGNYADQLGDNHVSRVQHLNYQLQQLNNRKNQLAHDILLHEENINATINEIAPKSIDFLNLEADRVAQNLKQLAASYVNLKREIAQLDELSLQSA